MNLKSVCIVGKQQKYPEQPIAVLIFNCELLLIFMQIRIIIVFDLGYCKMGNFININKIHNSERHKKKTFKMPTKKGNK